MIGKVLGNRYEIIEKIGGGGMALVYKAKCNLLDRFVAIKVLKDEFVDDEEFVMKFRRESQAAASLSHPNIVNIYDVGMEEGADKNIHYIVMEYIDGKTLKQIIVENGKISIDESINYTNQIASALNTAHENGIIHRDIKPHNIMITKDNRVKVTDFGIARAATSSTMTTKSDVLGSVHYFSPEQARGGYTDDKSDIYSLGIVMYEMVTGKLPYQGESPITVALKHVQEDIIPPRDLDPNIPVGFEQIILKAVQKRQADRYKNIKELIEDLKLVKANRKLEDIETDNDFDGHTRIIPTIKAEDEEMNIKNTKKKKKNKKGGKKEIILGVLLAFLLVTSIYIGYGRAKDFFSNEEIVVPNLVGKEEVEAKTEIEDLGLEFKVLNRIKDSEYEEGQIISQEQAADSKVKKGYPIGVIVSSGKDAVPVPRLANRSFEDAKRMLEEKGLMLGSVDYEDSEDIPVDVVIRQDPGEGSEVAPNARINLILSKGKEVAYVNMKNLVGLSLAQAEAEIKKMNLQIGETKVEPNEDVAKGIVFWQSYESGTELESDTAVDLYVSSGPDESQTEEEPVEETPPVEEKPPVEEVSESPISFTLTPLQDQDQTTIKIERRQDGGSKVVYNKVHLKTDGEVPINLEGKPGAQFDIYYNDIYQTTIE